MLQATRDGIEIGAARLDRLDAATNQDHPEAASHAEVRCTSLLLIGVTKPEQLYVCSCHAKTVCKAIELADISFGSASCISQPHGQRCCHCTLSSKLT